MASVINENISSSNISKNDAIGILDRIIGFINNCDSKASIVLGIFGVILTIIFTWDGIKALENIIITALKEKCFCHVLYLIFFTGSVLLLVFGLFKLMSVLIAKTKYTNFKKEIIDLDSKIYFGTIAENNTYTQYKEKLLTSNEDDLLNDIISQIYLNASICNNKFKNYNYGIICSMVGFFSFAIIWTIGTIIF